MTKALPTSLEAECSVIGCLLFDNDCHHKIASWLLSTDFYDFINKAVYEVINRFIEAGQTIDLIILIEHFKDNSVILREISANRYWANTVSNVEAYAKIIKEKSLLRQLIQLTAKFNNEAYLAKDVVGLLNQFSTHIDSLKGNIGIEPAVPYLQSFQELLLSPPPTAWLIEGWLEQEKFCMLHGRPASAKSFVALDWALHIASDAKAWRNHAIDENGTVVYLAGEGHHGIKKRIKAWAQHYCKKLAKLFVSHKGSRLDDEGEKKEVFDALRSLPEKPLLVIVDTLHEFSAGNLNNIEESGRLIRVCKQIITEFKTTLLLVHHTGHSESAQQRGMGHTRWLGSLDTDINCSRNEQKQIILKNNKQKDNVEAPELYFELKDVLITDWVDSKGRPMKSAVLASIEPAIEENDKEDARLTKCCRLITEIYVNGSKSKTPEGKALITRSEIYAYLTERLNMTPKYANQMVKPSFKKGIVFYLLENKVLSYYNQESYILIIKSNFDL